MDNKDLFKTFYNDLYKSILDEYYGEIDKMIKSNNKLFIIMIIIFAIIPTICLWMILFETKNIIPLILLTIVYDISVFLFFKSNCRDNNRNLLNNIKYKILDDLLTLITAEENTSVIPDNRISKASFEKSMLFNLDKVIYNGSNYIKTKIDNKDLVLADIDIYTFVDKYKQEHYHIGSREFVRTYKLKKKKDLFKGCYIGSDTNRNNDILIQLVPHDIDEKNDNYTLIGNKIDLENSEFNKKYSVYSFDEIKARMILTLPMMEKINDLDKVIANQKMIVFKPDGRYVVFIKDMTIENILNKNLPSNRNIKKELDAIYNIYTDLSKIFEISNILNNSR